MSYRTLLETKRLAADKPTILMTLGELYEHERKGDDLDGITEGQPTIRIRTETD